MLESYKDNEILYICTNNKKEIILKQITKNKKIYNIKFMTLEEFKSEYFFKYNIDVYPYMMEKYNISYNTSKEYLKNMYYIDISNTYSSNKIELLKNIKIDLINNKYLVFNNRFKNYIKNKKIIVDYNMIDPYMKNIFLELSSEIISSNTLDKEIEVLEFDDIETEVNNTILKILDLVNKGVSLNNIIISYNNSEYDYTLKRMFNLYNLEIDLDLKISLNTVLFIQEYFVTGKIPDINEDNKEIIKKFVNLLNKYVEIKDSVYYKEIIKEELKNTYLQNIKYKESVKTCNIDELEIEEDKYIFILGFNEGIIPNTIKDEDFFSDLEKNILGIVDSVKYNYYERENIYNKITNINNLVISYTLHGFSEEYYPSSIISDNSMKIINKNLEDYTYSNKYNIRKNSILLDNYYRYGEKNDSLDLLLNNYDYIYNTYNHKFSGIDHDKYINYISKPLKLSYTALNTYNLCPFKYYVSNVLKVDPFEDTFMAFIGNLYHKLFSLCFYEDFDFDKAFNEYIETRVLIPKEKFLLKRLEKELMIIIDVLKEQKMYTDFKDSYYEKLVDIKLDGYEIDVIFKGIVDKIMYYNNLSDTYYAVIDYKTGSFPTSLNNMKYGLDMQLAIYIYLIEKGNIFQNPIFSGCYFQKTFIGNIMKSKNKTIKEVIFDQLKLRGYSTTDELILSHFDHSYTNSKIISGMSITEKGISSRCKTLNSEDVYNLVDYTDKVIKDTTSNILNNKFDISPKIVGGKDKACSYCKYVDICYKDINDYVELPKVEDLSFLGGDEDGE